MGNWEASIAGTFCEGWPRVKTIKHVTACQQVISIKGDMVYLEGDHVIDY